MPPYDNAHVESFMKTSMHGEIYLRPYHTLAELRPARSGPAVSSRTKSGF